MSSHYKGILHMWCLQYSQTQGLGMVPDIDILGRDLLPMLHVIGANTTNQITPSFLESGCNQVTFVCMGMANNEYT